MKKRVRKTGIISWDHNFQDGVTSVDMKRKYMDICTEKGQFPLRLKVTPLDRVAWLVQDREHFEERRAAFYGGSVYRH
jgi:hypothetical protein